VEVVYNRIVRDFNAGRPPPLGERVVVNPLRIKNWRRHARPQGRGGRHEGKPAEGDFEQLGESLRAGWEAKKKMAKSISNPQIDEIIDGRSDSTAFALFGRLLHAYQAVLT
jgi:hypothetical protein